MSLDTREVEHGVFSVLSEGISYEVWVEGERVWVNGHEVPVSVKDPRQWNPKTNIARGASSQSVVAPMPGKIVRLLVEPGDLVTAGQGILVIEAMKMQNELKASRAGSIARISVKQNETVTAGTILVVME